MLKLETAIRLPGIFIATEGKVACPLVKEKDKKNSLGIRTCYICMGSGETTEENLKNFKKKAFAEYMRKLRKII